ncbi:MAG: hypothetical protein IPJ76_14565 [Flavobacteriales bacterium]|nr:MAG: hypothetical protein IPJ76_14565 [Flavobacteriales bacterium]
MAKKAAAKAKKSAPGKATKAARPKPGKAAKAKKPAAKRVVKKAAKKSKPAPRKVTKSVVKTSASGGSGKKAASKPAPKRATPVRKPARPAGGPAPKPAPKPVKVAPKAPAKPAKSAAAPAKPAAPPVPAAPNKPVVIPTKGNAPPAPKPAPPAPKPTVVIKKKPLKERFSIEFLVHSTPSALYDMLLSPSGFSEWYCDDVDVRGDEYTFKWGGEEEKARLIGQRQNEVTRWQRLSEEDPEAFYEFRIKIDPITNELALIVTDHAWPNELENAKALWHSQIANLTRVLGA